jgi:hypothetical protein
MNYFAPVSDFVVFWEYWGRQSHLCTCQHAAEADLWKHSVEQMLVARRHSCLPDHRHLNLGLRPGQFEHSPSLEADSWA